MAEDLQQQVQEWAVMAGAYKAAADEAILHLSAARSALRGLLAYRAHRKNCAEPMTDFCTCGMKETAADARKALGQEIT